MTWQYLYILIIFTATAVSIAIAFYAWKKRRKTGALYFSGTMLAVAEWLFTSGMVSISASPRQAEFWVSPRYFGLTAMLAFFICFAIEYTGHERWLTRNRKIIIFAVPLITQAIIETNALHNAFLVDVTFSKDGILMGLDSVEYGLLFWFHTVYSYLIVLVGITLIVRRSIRTFHLYRDQSILMILGILPPLITSAIDAFLLIPGLKHPLAPLGFAFMGVCFAWSMFKHRMLDIVPVARDTVIESMTDAMIVLDSNAKVIDINPAALQVLQLGSHDVIGQPIAGIFPFWNEIAHNWQVPNCVPFEITKQLDGQDLVFDIRISPLKGRQVQGEGCIILLRDITSHKQEEKQLQDMLEKVNSLQEQLYEQTIRDYLTALFNRRYLDEVLQREMNRAHREEHPVSFLMMDLDHFKSLNDQYGHEIGDMVLKHTANMLLENTRTSDYAFRYGGEEFLVLLPATHPQDAEKFAERWHAQLQAHEIISNGQRIHVTMSIGISAFLPGMAIDQDYVAAADTAMYRAKANGRNRTFVLLAEE